MVTLAARSCFARMSSSLRSMSTSLTGWGDIATTWSVGIRCKCHSGRSWWSRLFPVSGVIMTLTLTPDPPLGRENRHPHQIQSATRGQGKQEQLSLAFHHSSTRHGTCNVWIINLIKTMQIMIYFILKLFLWKKPVLYSNLPRWKISYDNCYVIKRNNYLLSFLLAMTLSSSYKNLRQSENTNLCLDKHIRISNENIFSIYFKFLKRPLIH